MCKEAVECDSQTAEYDDGEEYAELTECDEATSIAKCIGSNAGKVCCKPEGLFAECTPDDGFK